jgi:tRNA nucleotidyltransferase (CCA-adding enzyme)
MSERLLTGRCGGFARRRRTREDPQMRIPSPGETIKMVRALPSGSLLLERLDLTEPVYLVGGAVRDLLLGLRPLDLDLVIEGDSGAFARKLDPDARVHGRFGTATFTLNGYVYDIARARAELYPRPGALPEVEAADLSRDLLRRDFTVNALAVALGGAEPGELVAAPLALEDLDARRLRVLYERSFIDDPTRLFRLVRYATRLAFAIEERTAALAAAAVTSEALRTVSGPRIGTELRLLAREEDPVAAISALDEFALGGALHPSFGIADRELARRALDLLPADGRRDLVTLAAATIALPDADLAGFLDRLGFEARERDVIARAASAAGALADALDDARSPSEIAAAVGAASPEAVALAGAFGPAAKATEWLDELRHVRLEIDGSDLVAAGLARGPQIGLALRAALAAKLDGSAPDRESQLARALQAARASG